mgnify:FL=1
MLTNQILTTREAAEYLKIHPETLRDYTRRGFIKASIFGNKLRFRTIDLDLYFDRQCVQGGDDACYTEEKIQAIGGLRSKSTDEEYNALLGLTTKPKRRNTATR